MRRPAMRQVNSRFLAPGRPPRYEKLKRRTTAAAAILLLVLVAGGVAWVFVPQPAMASMFPWSKPAAIPTLYTGASFSVTIASLDSADGANGAASRVRGLGMPAFTRRSPGKDQVYQAMVGPFASLDEAEKTQRRLGGMGYRGARIFVDESLRTTPRGERPIEIRRAATRCPPPRSTRPAVARLRDCRRSRDRLVRHGRMRPRRSRSTPGRCRHPRTHSSGPRRRAFTSFIPCRSRRSQRRAALNYVRARIDLPEFAKANVRTEGPPRVCRPDVAARRREPRAPRRMTAESEGDRGAARVARPGRKCARQNREAARGSGRAVPHRRSSRSISASARCVRFCCPLRSQGRLDVYAALDQTFAALEESLIGMNVPPSEAGQHS